jgi:hypothetical protein
MRKISFKSYLFNENKEYLNHRIGDVLNALHDLNQNSQALGTRQLVRNATTIVNQIRRILHTGWEKTEEKTLKELQKVGVAIAKAIDEKDDLQNVLQTAASALEQLTSEVGSPINNLGAPDEGKEGDKESLSPEQGKKDRKKPEDHSGETPGGPMPSPGEPQMPSQPPGPPMGPAPVGT